MRIGIKNETLDITILFITNKKKDDLFYDLPL